ncbi:MAG TPA: hypothetical protein VMI54_05240 [Polyangiaceae bacterium]|nr:hypothetical protein [Polyangiaceae bacterium]
MAARLLTAGSLFASRWIVGGLLGRSESAEVYEVEEASQRRFAALKLHDPALALEPAFGEYARVTRAVSELPGDGIARAYDVGVESTLKRPYVASERITFPTLSRYVNERGPLPLRALAPALATLAAALDAAHGAGIVHGGLKPQNVFVSFDDPHWARLTDFALGPLRAAAGRGPSALLGWSAPETATGPSTPASDRYALGLVCFFAATGIPWYNALHAVAEPDGSQHRQHLASERAKSQGGELDPLFDAWFAKALANEPDARFASAVEMARAFLDVFTGAPTAEMPARSLATPLAETLPLRPSRTPTPPTNRAYKRVVDTVPLPAAYSSSRPPGPAPVSSLPPRLSSSLPPLAKTRVPRWFWLACAAIAVVAVLSILWLSRH